MTATRQTRAFLFADLRDYSRFTERHGDDAATHLLARYRTMVREGIARFDGAEIRTEGDSFYVVFTSVGSAVQAGLAILDGAEAASVERDGEPIRVGIGIHAGETIDGEQGIVSSAVNIAARVCSVAGPGQLLVTDTVRSLVRGYVAARFTPVGSRRLKGITEPVALYRVEAGGITHTSRPARSFPASLPRSWLRRGAIAAAIALVVAAVAIIGGTVMREGIASDDPTTSTRQVAVSPTTEMYSRAASASASLASFPTPAEQGLFGIVDEASRDRCARRREAPTYLAPVPVQVPTPGNLIAGYRAVNVAFEAGIECALGGVSAPDELRIWQLRSREGRFEDQYAAPATVVTQKAGENDARGTTCSQEIPAIEEWSFGENSGTLTCYETDTGDAVLWWSYDGTDVLAMAVSEDRDMGSLLSWWAANARFAP